MLILIPQFLSGSVAEQFRSIWKILFRYKPWSFLIITVKQSLELVNRNKNTPKIKVALWN